MKFVLVEAALALGTAMPAHADVYSYSGDTTGAPVMHRPISTSVLSGVGTATRYEALSFHVDTSGVYSFQSVAGYDNYTLLYQDSFVPSASLQNLIAVNDDIAQLPGFSGFLTYLYARTPYVFVSTGFENADFGSFDGRIEGNGAILLTPPVPEPETYAMFLAGLSLIAVWRKRQRRIG